MAIRMSVLTGRAAQTPSWDLVWPILMSYFLKLSLTPAVIKPTVYGNLITEHRLKYNNLAILVTGLACAATLAACTSTPPAQAARGPRVNVVATATVAPPPPPPVVVEPAYVPAPNDIYIAAVVDRDVVFVDGSTYVWYLGIDGRRHRHFYARGDHRQEIFHRRDTLRVVMAHHGGHLPSRPTGHSHGPVQHPVSHPAPVVTHNHPKPAAPHVNRTVAMNKQVPGNKPPHTQDVKKS